MAGMTAIRNIVVLTGAGVSAESGLATFRGPDGLWDGHRVQDVCTPEALAVDPALVHGFYDVRREALTKVTPNPAHIKAFQLLGAVPTPMAFTELFTALEMGSVDGQENPVTLILNAKFFEVQKHLTLTRHAKLWYNDAINPLWRANETLTMRRVAP